ncbi:MAG TPA: AAA family ATPase [Cellvibrio sp.]|nr:AAA family ATPase [Cellvibrio sp.]
MEIEIKHCNNIDSAKISLTEGKLNIRFAPNGTGKSTIAKAIKFKVLGQTDKIDQLRPFKHKDDLLGDTYSQVGGVDSISKIMCFDEDYVNQFTFKPDELISNSFDIFVRTDEYKTLEQDIANLVGTIKQTFTSNPDLETFITNLKELGGAFTLSKTGLSKSSSGMKGLSMGNSIQHIPLELEPYQPFIQSTKSVNWIEWQTTGHKEFSELSDACPFCTTDTTDKKEKITSVGKKYNKNIIKNLIGILDIVEKLGGYFSEETKTSLAVITTLTSGLEKEHETFLVTIKSQIDNLIEKLESLKGFSGLHFKDGEKVAEKLPSYKLDLQFFSSLDSQKTRDAVMLINSAIDELGKQAGQLQGKIQAQRQKMQKLIEKHELDINNFLAYAGYRYKVEIAGAEGSSQLKLLHIDHAQHLSGGSQHLSFGERNAFSIVLFMYECLAKNPDLIILDDPISSFDKNKKYAILEMLFKRDAKNCFKGKTVLMLTHDVEPIIDTLKSVKGQFSNQVSAAFLRLQNGKISEQKINSGDIKTFIQICGSVLASNQDPIIKMIYLRRQYEVLGDLGDTYEVLSNLFKQREIPEDHRIPKDDQGNNTPMSAEDLAEGLSELQDHIPELPMNYSSLVALFRDECNIKTLYSQSVNGYEKLQFTRILLNIEDVENSVIRKFINETYHIENEFIFQLDPNQFDLIPEYVVKACDQCLADA